MTEQKPDKTGIAAIVMTGIVFIICILASATVVVVFFLNAPW